MSGKSSARDAIQDMFAEKARHKYFGNVLLSMRVRGFRCHANTIIDIESPITAICGLNGTGKSTILQMAAIAYKNERSYTIDDFMVVSRLDPNPFTENATAEYLFAQADQYLKEGRVDRSFQRTISRNAQNKRWQGYERRPPRPVRFAGIGLYLPRVEQRDFIVRNARRLQIDGEREVVDRIKQWACQILTCSYDTIVEKSVAYVGKTQRPQRKEVVSVGRSHVHYSEAHMGYGEARTLYLANLLETSPDRSLILIEEPETALHENAQYEMGQYLMDVVRVKRHQILLTTHSEAILKALPAESRLLLQRSPTDIEVIRGMSATQAKSLMADGHVKALRILVEDDCAKAILTELLRRIDQDFVRTVDIRSVGGADQICKAMQILRATDCHVVAVLDGDQAEQPKENIFKLPGQKAPEKELFSNAAVKDFCASQYRVNLDSVSGGTTDHHLWLRRLAERVTMNETALMGELARVYASTVPEVLAHGLTTSLKAVA